MSLFLSHARHRVAAITGAGTYSGRYICELLQQDPTITEIRNFTNHPERRGFVEPSNGTASSISSSSAMSKSDSRIPITTCPLNFEKPQELAKNLRCVEVLYCTYWMRFHDPDPEKAVDSPGLKRIRTLVDAYVAAEMNVEQSKDIAGEENPKEGKSLRKKEQFKRLIYVSHTRPDVKSEIPYIRAKALAEEYIRNTADLHTNGYLRYGFIRPCCLFGDTALESIVLNNTAYLMRTMPLLTLTGHATKQHFQPVHVRDLAEMCVAMAEKLEEDNWNDGSAKRDYIEAVGPEKLTFLEFMTMLKSATGSKSLFLGGGFDNDCNTTRESLNLLNRLAFSPWMVYQMTRPINWWLKDIFVDKGDLDILVNNVASSELDAGTPEAEERWGKRSLVDWCKEHGEELGKVYINSYDRYYDKEK